MPMVDARQLERWGLDSAGCPPAASSCSRSRRCGNSTGAMALGAFGALLVQGGLIGGLLVQRAQRRRAQQSLAERLRFETLLSDLAARFAASTPVETEGAIQRGLQLIGESLGVDWVTVRTLDERGDEARLAQAWTRKGVPSRPAVIRATQTPWIIARLRQDQVVHLARPADLPDEAAVDRQTLQGSAPGPWSWCRSPGTATVLGCLAVGTAREGRGWSDLLTGRLRLLAEVFVHALERQRAVDAAQESDAQIRDLAGRLMSAQEEERRRIARDLHDDVNQELAALSIALSALGGRLPPEAPGAARGGRPTAGARGRAGGGDPPPLSRAPSGRAPARRRGRRAPQLLPRVRADAWPPGDVPGGGRARERAGRRRALPLPGRAGRARQRRQACGGRRGARDRGRASGPTSCSPSRTMERGFDQAEARSRRGLGLLSLDERARLVGGRLTIDTKPQRGTELRIVVPITEVEDAARDRVAG